MKVRWSKSERDHWGVEGQNRKNEGVQARQLDMVDED